MRRPLVPWALVVAVATVASPVIGAHFGPSGPSVPSGALPPSASGPAAPCLGHLRGVVDPLAGGRQELIVGSADNASVPNSGLETNLTMFNLGGLPANAAFQVSTFDVIGRFVAVFGLFANTTILPVPFYSIYTNVTDQQVRLTYWPGLAINPGDPLSFGLTEVSGGTWQFTLDGRPFQDNATAAEFDFGSNTENWTRGIGYTELMEWAGEPYLPPAINTTAAYAVDRGGSWYLPRPATATTDGGSTEPWGIAGTDEEGTLAPGELASGPAVATLPNGSVLWSTGPVNVSLQLHAFPTLLLASGGAEVEVVATSMTGAPLSGAWVVLRDTAGGTFLPAIAATSTNGTASVGFVAPNASAAVTDSLIVASDLLGFVGWANTTVAVAAAVHVSLASSGAVTVVQSTQTHVSFRVENSSGAPLAGLGVSFALFGPGGLIPVVTVSDTSGMAGTTILAPGGPTEMELTARVVAVGYWGVASTAVHVVPPPPEPWSQRVLPFLLAPIAGGIAALGMVLYLRFRRRRYRPLPPFRVRRSAPRPRPGPPESPPPAQP